MTVRQRARPVIVVTGANGGIGFAVCHRLLAQLVHRVPPDALPQRAISRAVAVDEDARIDAADIADCDGLTLVLACRNTAKADAAKRRLLALLDAEVAQQKRRRGDNGHAARLRENVVIAVHRLDLSSVDSVFSFARQIQSKYSYVSHLVCNAGVASFTGYNWILCAKQLCTEFVAAVTSPIYKLQRIGEMSEDGFGWIWQCNLFGHYVLFRSLEPLLARYEALSTTPARVLWMTSVEAYPSSYDPADWQLVRSARSYEASKYQMELLVGHLEQAQHRALAAGAPPPVRHLLCHPGVVRTNIALESLNSKFLEYLMQLCFFIAHFLGSPTHVMTPYKAAVSAVHLMLVALPFVSAAAPKKGAPYTAPTPLKFGSQVDFWFNEYVGTAEVEEWDTHSAQGAQLAGRCEQLYRTLAEKQTQR